MAKESGLGDGLLVNGYDLSGDIQQVNNISSPRGALDVTGIDKSAYERIYGLKDGVIDMTTHFNTAAGRQFPTLKTVPDTDSHVMYRHRSTLGNPAAALVSKRTDFAATRANDGGMTFAVNAQANAFGLDWGVMLTPGVTTITSSGNQTSVDLGTGTLAFGFQAYIQVTAFTGTDATVRIQHSSDNGSGDAFADITGGSSFTQITSGPTYQRITGASATTSVERYVRLTVATTGGFSSLSYIVMFHRNDNTTSF